MKPKTITAKIVVPEWAKWIAADENGSLHCYSQKPITSISMWATHGIYERIGVTTPPRNWRKTIRRVK